MDLQYGAEYEDFRRELQKFLASWPPTGPEAALPLDQQERWFRQQSIDRGYAYRDIPKQYGGSEQENDTLKERIIVEEFSRSRAPLPSMAQGPAMLVPTLLEFGSDEQRERYIRPTLEGEIRWCQGYSEPGSGSDLASLQCRAELQGDEFVITGQKIWTSGAAECQMMFGLFRSEPDASKHAGISYLLVPMDQPGIEVRPLRQMTGSNEFNEVFFDGARTNISNLVGRRGEGWQVSRATLKHERKLIGNPRLMARQFELLVTLAKKVERNGRPAIEDPGVQLTIAEIEGYVRAIETCNLRMLSAELHGEVMKVMHPMMMIKLYATKAAERIANAAYDLIGGDGLLDIDVVEMGMWATADDEQAAIHNYLFSKGPSIAGGASNIQRNIIGERVLGLPRDLRKTQEPDKPARS
jgi:alkylation response protein AidB-like acyl-CoA dehydrogenase